jgi:hypothetical protein
MSGGWLLFGNFACGDLSFHNKTYQSYFMQSSGIVAKAQPFHLVVWQKISLRKILLHCEINLPGGWQTLPELLFCAVSSLISFAMHILPPSYTK